MSDLVIGYGTTIEGAVHSLGTVVIHGCVTGHIQAHTVVCSKTADVLGHIVCEQLYIDGQLNGSFEAAEVIVRESAHVTAFEEAICTGTCRVAGAVTGQIRAGHLQLEPTARLNGQLMAHPSGVNPCQPGTAS